MEVRTRAFGVLATACVMAAGVGGYVALRQNAVLPLASETVAPAENGHGQPALAGTAPETVGTSQLTAIDVAASTVESVTPLATAAPGLTAEPKAEPVAARPRERARARTGDVKATAQANPATVEAPVPVPATGPATEVEKPQPSAPVGSGNGSQTASPDKEKPPLATPGATEAGVSLPIDDPATEPAEEPSVEELVVPADSVLGLEVETALSSAQSRVEDPVRARVTRDLRVGGRVAIPAGSEVLGSVTQVDRGSKMRERPRLGLRFHTLLLVDHTRASLDTETIYREGPAPAGKSAAKIGGAAVGGAILGAIIGGRKGALIGGSIGAAGGAAAVQVGEPDAATLPAGTVMTVRILSPVTVTVDRQ